MADMPDPSSLLERLINSRNRHLSLFLPFFLGFTSDVSMSGSDADQDDDHDSDNDRSSRDRIILINPLTQGMVVIEGRPSSSSSSLSSFESLLRELMSNSSKDGQPPASKASIEALPRVEIKEGEDEGECAICLEEWGVSKGDEEVVVREMPCKHRFHGGCVEKWLKVHGTCPVCRYRMPVDDHHDLGKKNEDSAQSQTLEESNERESEGRGRGGGGGRREIWVTFSIRNEDSTS